jgi:hypothetical protein
MGDDRRRNGGNIKTRSQRIGSAICIKKFLQRQLEEKKEGPQKLNTFICEKEESKRRVELKTDYNRLLNKSYQKKRRQGSSNSYIKQIPTSTPLTSAKKKEKQIDASTSNQTFIQTNKLL